SQTLARPGEMPAKYFRLPSATHGGLSLQDQGSENNGETSGSVNTFIKNSTPLDIPDTMYATHEDISFGAPIHYLLTEFLYVHC
ncbi:hypothetical protein, partial [Thiolapillus sp.]